MCVFKISDFVDKFTVEADGKTFTSSDDLFIKFRGSLMLDEAGYSGSREDINLKYLVAACEGYCPDDDDKFIAEGYGGEAKKDLRFGRIKQNDIANGPGIHLSLFVTGCHFHCDGCFNSEIWDRESGSPITNTVLLDMYAELANHQYAGISILGGEPMEPYNIEGVHAIAQDVKKIFGGRKSVWVYTGYNWDNLREYAEEGLLDYIDVIVDGPFIKSLKDPSLRFRGSSNQRIIDVQKSLKAGKVVLEGEE